jgi:hypothetical protein
MAPLIEAVPLVVLVEGDLRVAGGLAPLTTDQEDVRVGDRVAGADASRGILGELLEFQVRHRLDRQRSFLVLLPPRRGKLLLLLGHDQPVCRQIRSALFGLI